MAEPLPDVVVVGLGAVGDILQPIERGAIREADVLGDLYDLVSGAAAGRSRPPTSRSSRTRAVTST